MRGDHAPVKVLEDDGEEDASPLVQKYLTNQRLAEFASLFRIVKHADGSAELHFREGIRFVSEKDVVISSGMRNNPNRPGYVFGIWENPPLDQDGNPMQVLPFKEIASGSIHFLTAYFTQSGKLKVPSGYLPPAMFDMPKSHANSNVKCSHT